MMLPAYKLYHLEVSRVSFACIHRCIHIFTRDSMYLYVCTYLDICTYTYTCMYTYAHVCVYIHVSIRTRMRIYTSARTILDEMPGSYTYAPMSTYVHVHTSVCTRMRTYTGYIPFYARCEVPICK